MDFDFVQNPVAIDRPVLLILVASYMPETYKLPNQLKYYKAQGGVHIIYYFNENPVYIKQVLAQSDDFKDQSVIANENEQFAQFLFDSDTDALPFAVLTNSTKLWSGRIGYLRIGWYVATQQDE